MPRSGGDSPAALSTSSSLDLHTIPNTVLDVAVCCQLVEALSLMSVKNRSWHVEKSSAKLGTGLEEGMQWVVKNISK